MSRNQARGGFRAAGPDGPLLFTGDLQAMLASVTASTNGYCVVCGTGAGAVRLRDGEIDRVIDASGWLLGDAGSGYWLGHQAARAATEDLEGRGEATALTRALLGALNIEWTDERGRDSRPRPLQQLINAIYATAADRAGALCAAGDRQQNRRRGGASAQRGRGLSGQAISGWCSTLQCRRRWDSEGGIICASHRAVRPAIGEMVRAAGAHARYPPRDGWFSGSDHAGASRIWRDRG